MAAARRFITPRSKTLLELSKSDKLIETNECVRVFDHIEMLMQPPHHTTKRKGQSSMYNQERQITT